MKRPRSHTYTTGGYTTYTTHLKSCIQSTDYASKVHEVHTCINCEDTPALQGNETNMDTYTCICQGTFTPGSTTLSIPTHSRKIPQNFQQLEKESSNTVALPGFKHSADTTTHVENSRNIHSNGTLSTSLKTYTNTYANMDTNHTAHRDRDARKEAHLLSGPSEL